MEDYYQQIHPTPLKRPCHASSVLGLQKFPILSENSEPQNEKSKSKESEHTESNLTSPDRAPSKLQDLSLAINVKSTGSEGSAYFGKD